MILLDPGAQDAGQDAEKGFQKLDVELRGAKLAIALGADGSAVASTIAAVDAFLATALQRHSLSKRQTDQVLEWAVVLERYNRAPVRLGPPEAPGGEARQPRPILLPPRRDRGRR
jgi:hypothetical protein